MTVLLLFVDGHAARLREVRNPDAEGSASKRAALFLKRTEA
ncbi:hypothetical protein [Methylobacterium sp. Leaf118]|nr:hypothetical protein [Methylobacterium sp. Leaf118]